MASKATASWWTSWSPTSPDFSPPPARSAVIPRALCTHGDLPPLSFRASDRRHWRGNPFPPRPPARSAVIPRSKATWESVFPPPPQARNSLLSPKKRKPLWGFLFLFSLSASSAPPAPCRYSCSAPVPGTPASPRPRSWGRSWSRPWCPPPWSCCSNTSAVSPVFPPRR